MKCLKRDYWWFKEKTLPQRSKKIRLSQDGCWRTFGFLFSCYLSERTEISTKGPSAEHGSSYLNDLKGEGFCNQAILEQEQRACQGGSL